MGTLNEDLSAIKTVEDTLTSNKVARLCYTDTAYNNNDANGVAEYNVNHEQNIPVATPSVMKVNDTVLSKGYTAQASSVTRMLLNHFLGRLSYNVNKVNDNMSNLLSTLISHRGTANGLATLDADGRIPYSQLPESAVELKGYWNASTNTPTLADGTGDDGDEYYVDVAGSQDLGSGTQYFNVGDRVLYIDGVWKNINSTAVKSVNSVLPSAQGDVALPTKVISIDNTRTVTGAPALSAGDTIKALFTSDITGTDDTTGMSISYNGTSYPVKVPKEGVLSAFVATELTSGNFTYIDAYKYVEFMLNGNDELVIIGNPTVLSGGDYEVYADGNFKRIYSLTYNTTYLRWARETYDSRTKKVVIEGIGKADGSSLLGTTVITPLHSINTALYPDVDSGIRLVAFTMNNSSRVMYRGNGIQVDKISKGEIIHLEYFA
jgi:hypothetical protein